jgi:hypothetical protein
VRRARLRSGRVASPCETGAVGFGVWVAVRVAVGVTVGVAVGVAVGVTVGVAVRIAVGLHCERSQNVRPRSRFKKTTPWSVCESSPLVSPRPPDCAARAPGEGPR